MGERRRAGKAVGGGPYQVARNLRRVSKEQERAPRQRRVKEVTPGAAKNLFGDNHAEGDAQRGLPQRQRGRDNQREKNRGDEKALVDFMLAHDGKEYLPEPPDDKYGDIDWQEVHRAEGHHAYPARIRGEAYPQPLRKAVVPVAGNNLLQLLCAIQLVQRRERLQANVIHAPEHRRERSEPHQDHHSLQIDGITNVSGTPRHLTGSVE